MELFRTASSSVRALSRPSGSRCFSRRICASVSVPVLSVHRTSMLPRSCTAASRLTITRSPAIRSAPRASVMDTTIGSSSGVSPTASATANRNDWSHGRWNRAFTSSTNSTMRIASRRMRSPKLRIPISNAVAGGFEIKLSLISPSEVAEPVRHTSMEAVPPTTEVPMNTAFDAASRSAAAPGVSPARFSTG